MTTVTNFQPSPNQTPPFQFSPTLDGQVYNITCTWNLYGERWYINIFALNGVRVLTAALSGSPDPIAIENIVWSNGVAIYTCASPHNLKVGTVVNLTITGCVPDAYNGVTVYAAVIDPVTLTVPIAANPGPFTVLGLVAYNINLVSGVFTTSTLVFRDSSQNFEVSP